MKLSSLVRWVVVAVLVVAVAATAYALWASAQQAVPLADVMAHPGSHAGKVITVSATSCNAHDAVFGHSAWVLSDGEDDLLYLGPKPTKDRGGNYAATGQFDAVTLFGRNYLVLASAPSSARSPREFAEDLIDGVRGLIRGRKEATDQAQASTAAIEGQVTATHEFYDLKGFAIETEDGPLAVVSAGYGPPAGAVVRVTGRQSEVLAQTDVATTLIEATQVWTPIAEVKKSPATYAGELIQVIGEVTSCYSLFGRSMFSVQDDTGESIEVWSRQAGHAVGEEVLILGAVRSIMGWGEHQLVILIEQPLPTPIEDQDCDTPPDQTEPAADAGEEDPPVTADEPAPVAADEPVK